MPAVIMEEPFCNLTFSPRNVLTVLSMSLNTRQRGNSVNRPGLVKLFTKKAGGSVLKFLVGLIKDLSLFRDEQCQLAGLVASVKARMTP